jgi:REP element-mobilizing transposase RayT
MAATLNHHNCPAIEVGGATDHVHILLRLSRTMTVSQAVEKVKTSSSKWLKPRIPDFAWQAGYGAFSVSRSDAGEVIAYIRGQEEHHRKVTFKEEYLALLEELGVSYSTEYLWD